MKKALAVGSLFLALGMASCKTYCPAYNYAKAEPDTNQKASSTVTSHTTDKANS